MFVVICYDVNTEDKAGRRRLRQIAKKCESYGQRVQNSIFECTMEQSDYMLLENDLIDIIETEKDSLRIYFLDSKEKKRIKQYGKSNVLDFESPLIL